MLIILTLYAVLLWLVFSKFKLIKWGRVSGTVAVPGGAFILAVFPAMFCGPLRRSRNVRFSAAIEAKADFSRATRCGPIDECTRYSASALRTFCTIASGCA
jgi:hypothetical protein